MPLARKCGRPCVRCARAPAMASSRAFFRLPEPISLSLTLSPVRHGSGDPTIRVRGSEALRASRTPDGPSTLHIRGEEPMSRQRRGGRAPSGQQSRPRISSAFTMTGAHSRQSTQWSGELHRRVHGLRLCRSGSIIEVLVPTILEQKITSQEARRSFHALVHRFGEAAPGPGRLKLQPSPERLATLPYWAFHPLGVARTRAETIRRVCKVASRMEEAALMTPESAAAACVRSSA